MPPGRTDSKERSWNGWPSRCDSCPARRPNTAGARDYSIYIHDSDLFAHLVVDDFAAFRAAMAATEVNDRWQAEMAALIDPLTDPATGFHRQLEEIFHLE